MATTTGSYDISALLAARFQSVAAYGLSTVQEILAADIATHNAIVADMLGELCEVTTDRQRIYGTSVAGEMVEVDEFGRAPAQKDSPGSTVAFPLKKFSFALGWTGDYFQEATPADLAIKTQAAEKAHLRAIQLAIRRAIFNDDNYTARDYMVDNVDLAVKRFVNADSAAIPDGPNGETFDGAAHTHYNANATLTAAALTANVEDVIEHGHGGQVRIAIARAEEAAVRALTGFTAYLDPRSVAPLMRLDQALDITRMDNRAIGLYGAAEVWVKPWALNTYPFCWDAGASQKPLCFRQKTATSLQGLRIAASLDTYPLYAQYMEAYFGVGVWSRTNGAILYDAGGAWADPTIT
jgi:hypothetical protein